MNRGERQHLERTASRRHQNTPRPLGYHSKYPGKTPGKLCSCAMCGNPRRHFGDRTRQETLASLDAPETIAADLGIRDDSDDWMDEYPCDCVYCVAREAAEEEERLRVRPLMRQPLLRQIRCATNAAS